MSDELIDLCDEHNVLTGKQAMKSLAHASGLWHRACHIWVYTPSGNILLQHRAKHKPLFPDVWDVAVGGHVGAGEEVRTAALREINEEIGLNVRVDELEFLNIRKTSIQDRDIQNNEFIYVYLLCFKGAIDELQVQKEELDELQFFPLADFETIQERIPCIPGSKEYWSSLAQIIRGKIQ